MVTSQVLLPMAQFFKILAMGKGKRTNEQLTLVYIKIIPTLGSIQAIEILVSIIRLQISFGTVYRYMVLYQQTRICRTHLPYCSFKVKIRRKNQHADVQKITIQYSFPLTEKTFSKTFTSNTKIKGGKPAQRYLLRLLPYC